MTKIKNAFTELIQGEREAVEKYTLFSNVAKDEGFKKISLLFDALIKAEKIHIKNHLNALGEMVPEVEIININVGSTLTNIEEALKGEVKENKSLYPRLIKSIKGEDNTQYGKVAKLSMTWAGKVEKEHAKLLKLALKSVKKGIDINFENVYFCKVCGNVEINWKSEKECKVCGHDSIFFKKITGVN